MTSSIKLILEIFFTKKSTIQYYSPDPKHQWIVAWDGSASTSQELTQEAKKNKSPTLIYGKVKHTQKVQKNVKNRGENVCRRLLSNELETNL